MQSIQIDSSILNTISPETAHAYKVFPIELSGDVLTLGVVDGMEEALQDELQILIGYKLNFISLSVPEVDNYLIQCYKTADKAGQDTKESAFKSNDRLIWDLINEARQLGSSDIHMEPFEEYARVRFRLDGRLFERYRINIADYPAYVNQIKIQSSLDISEKRLPQDGRLNLSVETDTKVDLRVSVLPSMFGEKIVLRILHQSAESLVLEDLGMHSSTLKNYLANIDQPHGLMLISGPTGSGKTTTLYATLKYLNRGDKNILTVEDPIEYTLEGITQVQVRDAIGLSFARAIRTFLRQDPDIIMVGEIRDIETAQIAIRASLTGHLVLSTIHTNSAWGIITRLLDMQIPAYLIAETVNMVVAQRLLRLLCQYCKKQTPDIQSQIPEQYRHLLKSGRYFEHTGCAKCHFSGYTGRRAIYEVVPIDNFLSKAIKQNTLDVSMYLDEKRIPSLPMTGIELYDQGMTSLSEISFLLNEV
jgi:type IV pilus assembly protein PilB